ncbi:hypothetical protein ymoll0001_29310 [Yersinia mollaretii ATCC 43969]|uniref:Uncharacterized protein n=1 Tax=Yersinia mollaretii (strain ATCC 43969 / DSM 18520 / CIP 103324 / CNY 7263 / WAIP 204) TaxID=349967 RepID=A0ABM9YBI3_YERMW|nr:hypothetical protein ymoll0001_29310 [Yersinia mollaretii ATCC 43969]
MVDLAMPVLVTIELKRKIFTLDVIIVPSSLSFGFERD